MSGSSSPHRESDEGSSQSASCSPAEFHAENDDSDLNDPAVVERLEQTLLEDDFLGETKLP